MLLVLRLLTSIDTWNQPSGFPELIPADLVDLLWSSSVEDANDSAEATNEYSSLLVSQPLLPYLREL